MFSYTEAFLERKAKAFPCGKNPGKSVQMLEGIDMFKGVELAPSKTKLRSALGKRTLPTKAKVGGRG